MDEIVVELYRNDKKGRSRKVLPKIDIKTKEWESDDQTVSLHFYYFNELLILGDVNQNTNNFIRHYNDF